ncbi:MAG: hypothetical protein B7733_14325 [Myxococcales bacterium FL481]|nr:MAG: hypothetical protein B7733_14325 [Myxococcales bacterium FL481]
MARIDAIGKNHRGVRAGLMAGWLVAACASTPGDDDDGSVEHDPHDHGDGDPHDPEGHGSGDPPDGHGEGFEPYLCASQELILGVALSDHTGSGRAELEMCHTEASGAELGYHFVAPAEGLYRFRVESHDEAFDPTLGIIRGGPACDGERVACSDDRGRDTRLPEVGTYLTAAESVIAIVDGKVGATGPYTLVVEAMADERCPDEVIDAGPLPIVVYGDTSDELNTLNGTCSGSGPDRSYLWTAPYEGRFVFETVGSVALGHDDPLLHVRDGGCGGGELACRDDIEAGVDLESRVELELAADQTVVVVVDGWIDQSGPFALTIRPANRPGRVVD